MLDGADRELGGAAADVADRDGARRAHEGDGALERKPCLLVPREDANGHAGRARERVDELIRVARLPAGRGDDDVDQRSAARARDVGEAAQALGRVGELDGRDRAVALDVGAEADRALAVGDANESVPAAGGDQEPDRVRPHVDDGDVHRRAFFPRPRPTGGVCLVTKW